MIKQKFCILEQPTTEFENSETKNSFIQANQCEWIIFIDQNVTTKSEVQQILDENPDLLEYDAILFGKNVPSGECDVMSLLSYPDSIIFALCFRQSILLKTGSYNRHIKGNIHYEFLLRLAEKGTIYSIPCDAPKSATFHPQTMAYILRHYIKILKEHGQLEHTFLRFTQIAQETNQASVFNDSLNTLLNDSGKYETIHSDTSPILIMVNNNGCYSVVANFANLLGDQLIQLGQAVILTNNRYGNYTTLPTEQLLGQNYKAIIGFQSPILASDTLLHTKGKRFQFWFDNPIFTMNFFSKTPKETCILCQDGDYADFIKHHFSVKKSIQFPPAGNGFSTQDEKIYDIAFIGSYIQVPDLNNLDDFQQEFYEFMLAHPHYTIEQGIRELWNKQDVEYDEQLFLQTIARLQNVCFKLLQDYRHLVIETILNAGIKLDVFGESWKNYHGHGKENLIIHPEVIGDDAIHTWNHTKIGLNIMNGHKNGMTERIANIMLCGACCLSDESTYLKENFIDGEELVLFSSNKLEQLPDKIRYLLIHDAKRKQIARAGYENAQKKHTWQIRAKELLELIENFN